MCRFVTIRKKGIHHKFGLRYASVVAHDITSQKREQGEWQRFFSILVVGIIFCKGLDLCGDTVARINKTLTHTSCCPWQSTDSHWPDEQWKRPLGPLMSQGAGDRHVEDIALVLDCHIMVTGLSSQTRKPVPAIYTQAPKATRWLNLWCLQKKKKSLFLETLWFTVKSNWFHLEVVGARVEPIDNRHLCDIYLSNTPGQCNVVISRSLWSWFPIKWTNVFGHWTQRPFIHQL